MEILICYYIILFTAENIDIDILKLMQPEFRRLVTSHLSVGKQIKFTANLQIWQKQQQQETDLQGQLHENQHDHLEYYHQSKSFSNVENINNITNDDIVRKNDDIFNIKNVNLFEILKTTNDGKSILQMYEDKRDLNETTRSILLKLIITFFHINTNLNMSAKTAENLSNQIIVLFPNEMKVIFIYS